MSDQSPSMPDNTNAATGVDKAMKQFSQTDAERERPSVDSEPKEKSGSESDAHSETQPPRSDAPADASSPPER